MNKANGRSKQEGIPVNHAKPGRILKVSEVGDFYLKRTKPLIRLHGKWLEKAGIPPNSHVIVRNPAPGVLNIHKWSFSTPQEGQPVETELPSSFNQLGTSNERSTSWDE